MRSDFSFNKIYPTRILWEEALRLDFHIIHNLLKTSIIVINTIKSLEVLFFGIYYSIIRIISTNS